MKISNFFKKFVDTYKETYEAEEKILMKRQRDRIDSLKISASMSKELDADELRNLVIHQLRLLRGGNNVKT